MAPTEPIPYWGWVIKGMGGVLNIAESLQADEALCGEHHLEMLEYQASRAVHIWRVASAQAGRMTHAVPRPIEAISEHASFAPKDVLHFPGAPGD
jgi:hypothetical protein